MAVITDFDDFDGPNPHAFLSNFWREDLTIDDVTYPTAEHAFAAAKACAPVDRLRVLAALGPGEAKGRGRRVALREDWEEVKYDVMRVVLAHKFDLGTDLADALLSTGDALLVEGTYWRDEVWGVDLTKGHRDHRSPGRNWLGTLLMARRAELRSGVGDLPLPDTGVLYWQGGGR